MIRLTIASFTLALFAPLRPVIGQSLDIGGIEIALGENITPALDRLMKVYDVKFQDQMSRDGVKFWSVFEKRKSSSDDFAFIGSLRERAGRVIEVGKERGVSDPLEVSPLYVLWTAELNRRTKAPCRTAPTFWRTKENLDVLTGFATKCGAYVLRLNTPKKYSDDSISKIHGLQMFLSAP